MWSFPAHIIVKPHASSDRYIPTQIRALLIERVYWEKVIWYVAVCHKILNRDAIYIFPFSWVGTLNFVDIPFFNFPHFFCFLFHVSEPNYVTSLEHEGMVYFFFREVAVEYINCGKVSSFFFFFSNNLYRYIISCPNSGTWFSLVCHFVSRAVRLINVSEVWTLTKAQALCTDLWPAPFSKWVFFLDWYFSFFSFFSR